MGLPALNAFLLTGLVEVSSFCQLLVPFYVLTTINRAYSTVRAILDLDHLLKFPDMDTIRRILRMLVHGDGLHTDVEKVVLELSGKGEYYCDHALMIYFPGEGLMQNFRRSLE
jgi:hypothetical protein